MSTFRLRFLLNGEERSLDVAADALLLDVIRSLGLTGTKEGCGVGVCGLCTVVVDGLPASSCILPAGCVDGREVLTVEGVARQAPELIDAFVTAEGMQCGICTPGQVVSSYALSLEHPDAGEEEIRGYLAGNLCRCTGYVTIVEAVRQYLAR